jgi:hypothetical protein
MYDLIMNGLGGGGSNSVISLSIWGIQSNASIEVTIIIYPH